MGHVRLDLDASGYPAVPGGKPRLWSVGLQGGFCSRFPEVTEVERAPDLECGHAGVPWTKPFSLCKP